MNYRYLLLIIASLLIASQSLAQFVDFGRNKVQYSQFDWYTLSTEHFKIYYYKEEKELAEQGAFFAEEAYKELQQKFKHSLVDTVPLIFYASPLHFKQTNTTPGLIPDGVGGFFEFIKGRVVIPHEGSIHNFRHVIRHELVHVFMTSKVLNVLKSHGQITERVPPLWFTEGLAEFWSSEWDAQADMVLKDSYLEKYGVGLDNWERIYGTYLMYKFGQRVCMYIAEKFGEEKILEIIDNMWYDDNFSEVLKYTIGRDYEQFDKEFLKEIRSSYFADTLTQKKPSHSSFSIYTKSFAHKPAVSGNSIYFIGNETGYTGIFKADRMNKREADNIVEGENTDEFEQFHFFRTGIDIFKGQLAAFITQKGESDALHIYDINESKLLKSYSFKNIVGIGAPRWSSDGKKIVFPATEFSGKNDLYIFEPETENLKRLTNDYFDDREPDISSDGSFLVFSSDRGSTAEKNYYNIFKYELESDRITGITSGRNILSSPRLSDDDSKITFTSDADGVQNIWVMEAAGNEMRKLTGFTTASYDPVWMGNDSIVFSSFEKGTISIRLINGVSHRFNSADTSITVKQNELPHTELSQKVTGIEKKNIRKYEKEFSLDLATTSINTDPVFGTNAGGVLSISDMLGNERYYFLLFNNSNSETEFWKSFNIAISKLSLEKRLNYAYGVYHLSGKRYDLAESDVSYYERLYGGYVSFSYPLSFFRRFEASTSLAQSVKNIDILNYNRSLLLTNSIAYIKDNSLWGYTGPIDGERLNITLGYTSDLQYSNVNYYSLLFDYRKYFRLNKNLTLAARGQLFMNEGKNPRRYFMGGSWSLRGWDFNSLRGSKLWQANTELRFPIVNFSTANVLGIKLPIPPIKGALFVDAGNTFDSFDDINGTIGSIGAGLRTNLFGFLVLRYDTGKRIERNFTELQTDLFHQFFFGWDF